MYYLALLVLLNMNRTLTNKGFDGMYYSDK